jgi:acyl-CoA synthetase (AMP-forming)/AMP-acid ligase II
MGISDYTIDDLFQFNASNAGTQPAIISPEKTLTHQQFLDPVDQPSAGLVESGIEKGDRICILAQNSIEYVELCLSNQLAFA